jgi:hypothetical protein
LGQIAQDWLIGLLTVGRGPHSFGSISPNIFTFSVILLDFIQPPKILKIATLDCPQHCPHFLA